MLMQKGESDCLSFTIVKELHELIDQGLQLKVTQRCILAQFRVRSVYLDRVKAAQRIAEDHV